MNRVLAVAVVAAVSGFVSAAIAADARPAPLPGQSSSFVAQPCPSGLQRLLPGQYHLCMATNAFWQGQQAQAMDELHEAAGWGSKRAQLALGVAYFNGDRVAADRALGLAWLTVAAERHTPGFDALVASARQHASPAEREQADHLVVGLRATYADDVALAKARLRFTRESAPWRNNGAFNNANLYLAGVSNIYNDYEISDISPSLGAMSFGHTELFPLMREDQMPRWVAPATGML
jgi:hypothetical protein